MGFEGPGLLSLRPGLCYWSLVSRVGYEGILLDWNEG